MKRTIKVFLGEEPNCIGTLHYDDGPRERTAFVYDESWLTAKECFPLEPGLPLRSGSHYHHGNKDGSVFHAVFADTEPDGWGRRVILRDYAKRRQSERRLGKTSENTRLNSMDFLLAVDDISRVGALRYQDEQGVFCRTHKPGQRTAPPLIELKSLLAATRAVETDTETSADLAYLRGCGTSLGGMRPKCTVVDADGQLAIGKFPSVKDERAVTKGEVLAMQLAAAAGIDAAQTRLVDSDDVPVALVRRFDRMPDGRRLMFVSAATLLGVEKGDPQDHSYSEIVEALRQHGAVLQDDIEELWRRMAFSILITNVDDHLHNHGFLHVEKGKWRLAPAYDINPFPERTRELKTWISEETGPEATIDALMSVTSYFQIRQQRAAVILDEVERAVATWRIKGRELGLTNRELDQFGDAFEHPERTAAVKVIHRLIT